MYHCLMITVIEKTLVLAKADVLERGLLGRVLQRFEDTGLKIIAAKLVQATDEIARRHYTGTRDWKLRIGGKVKLAFKEVHLDVKVCFGTDSSLKIGEHIYQWSIDYLLKNPVLAIVIEGPHAVKRVEEITGHTEPFKAGQGTIRGDFGADSIVCACLEHRAIINMVHSSKTLKDANREIKTWFAPEEILKYKTH